MQQTPEYRAVTDLKQSTKALENSLFLLRDVATSTKTENESLCTLTEQVVTVQKTSELRHSMLCIAMPEVAYLYGYLLVSARENTPKY